MRPTVGPTVLPSSVSRRWTGLGHGSALPLAVRRCPSAYPPFEDEYVSREFHASAAVAGSFIDIEHDRVVRFRRLDLKVNCSAQLFVRSRGTKRSRRRLLFPARVIWIRVTRPRQPGPENPNNGNLKARPGASPGNLMTDTMDFINLHIRIGVRGKRELL